MFLPYPSNGYSLAIRCYGPRISSEGKGWMEQPQRIMWLMNSHIPRQILLRPLTNKNKEFFRKFFEWRIESEKFYVFGCWPKYLLFAERVVVGGTNWFRRGNSCECRGDNMSSLFFLLSERHKPKTLSLLMKECVLTRLFNWRLWIDGRADRQTYIVIWWLWGMILLSLVDVCLASMLYMLDYDSWNLPWWNFAIFRFIIGCCWGVSIFLI